MVDINELMWMASIWGNHNKLSGYYSDEDYEDYEDDEWWNDEDDDDDEGWD